MISLPGFSVHDKIQVWMSHGDRIKRLPPGFEIIGHSDNSPFAAMRDKERNIFGVQFHPEVVHTPQGKEILNNFHIQNLQVLTSLDHEILYSAVH